MRPTPSVRLHARALSQCVLLVAAIALSIPAHAAEAEARRNSYLRGGPIYVMPAGDDFDDGAGLLVQLGGTVGSFDLGLETGWVSLDADEDESPGLDISQDYVPLFAAFRGHWPVTRNGALVLQGGLLAGGALVRTEAGSDGDSKFHAAWGADVALTLRPRGGRLSFSFGYKYLSVEMDSFVVGPVLFSGPAEAHCLFATGGVRF